MPAINERLSLAQQENIVSLLCYSDQHGKIVLGLVDPALFEAEYREIVIKVSDYWRKHNKAPKLHTTDLFITELDGPRSNTFRRIFFAMAHMESQLNAAYVISGLQAFVRVQRFKASILKAADILGRQDAANPENIEEVEQVLAEVVKARNLQFDRGVKLDDDLGPFIEYLAKQHKEFRTGIKHLDDNNITPARGELFLFLAGKGRGKTWFMINVGRIAMRVGKKVLHVSLENSEMETRGRYYQCAFSIPRWKTEEIKFREMRFDAEGKMLDITKTSEPPKFDMQSPYLEEELETYISKTLGLRAGNLIIKRFPNRTLTMEMLEAYMDSLEQIDGFIPDILLLDYAKIMKLKGASPNERRIALGENFERLRGMAIERNIAVVTADQLNRKGYDTQQAHSVHIGEDWSQVHTADTVVTHSATDMEMREGLARLYVDHARTSKDKFGVLITQSFEMGQFVLESALLPDNYFEKFMPKKKEDGEEETSTDQPASEPEIEEL